MKSNQRWSSVCEDDFDQQDAEVVCRELGCGAPSVLQGALYGEVEAPMWTREFQCGGHESALLDCRTSGSDRNTCSPGEAVGLTCSGRKKHFHQFVLYILKPTVPSCECEHGCLSPRFHHGNVSQRGNRPHEVNPAQGRTFQNVQTSGLGSAAMNIFYWLSIAAFYISHHFCHTDVSRLICPMLFCIQTAVETQKTVGRGIISAP